MYKYIFRKDIRSVFQPNVIQFADALLKTRSGKIIRRILKAIVINVKK